MKLHILAIAAILACSAAQAAPRHAHKAKATKAAEKITKPPKADPRFQTLRYTSGVMLVCSHPGRMLEIEFGPDETKIDFKMGDRKAWNVSVLGNTLMLKPGEDMGDTNLRVITNRRKYWFDLTMTDAKCIAPYHIGFIYPDQPGTIAGDPAPVDPVAQAARDKALIETRLAAPLNAVLDKLGPQPVPSGALNDNYGFIGPDELMPTGAYDDGDMTYIALAPNNPLPSVFVVGADGSESRVGFHVAKGMLIVHRTARHLIFRRGPEGKITGCLINGSFRANGARPSYTVSNGVQRTIKTEASDVSQ